MLVTIDLVNLTIAIQAKIKFNPNLVACSKVHQGRRGIRHCPGGVQESIRASFTALNQKASVLMQTLQRRTDQE